MSYIYITGYIYNNLLIIVKKITPHRVGTPLKIDVFSLYLYYPYIKIKKDTGAETLTRSSQTIHSPITLTTITPHTPHTLYPIPIHRVPCDPHNKVVTRAAHIHILPTILAK